ncbi:AhpA/YtjB family protein [Alkalimonas collagenimarina]|uniref:AhpA/YtjB family protein n=1 Tax=Alkalimonas collagenimarina TaxID=400390 RepID=A0ABT9GUU8_9GAMM|nr:AhpA/YtjB family protein [Alkalimonas collagenimarina]MDP4534828.1 AhpA/YtjB family protein [Alkalimonas collagenimarina]
MQTESLKLSQTSRLVKLLQLLLAVLGLWLILHSWVSLKAQGTLLLQQQSEQLMRSTLQSMADTAVYLLENDQLDALNQLNHHIATNPYVYDVAVYDSNGSRISGSEPTLPARQLYALDYQEKLLPLLHDIRNEHGELLGYIRISLRTEQQNLPLQRGWHQLMQQVLWLLVLAGLVTFFLKRGHSRFSRLSLRVRKP